MIRKVTTESGAVFELGDRGWVASFEAADWRCNGWRTEGKATIGESAQELARRLKERAAYFVAVAADCETFARAVEAAALVEVVEIPCQFEGCKNFGPGPLCEFHAAEERAEAEARKRNPT